MLKKGRANVFSSCGVGYLHDGCNCGSKDGTPGVGLTKHDGQVDSKAALFFRGPKFMC